MKIIPPFKVKKKRKNLVAPHKKRKIVCSQQQALYQIAASVDQLVSVEMKKYKLSLETDLKLEMFLKYKQDEAKKNPREHNLKWQKLKQMSKTENT